MELIFIQVMLRKTGFPTAHSPPTRRYRGKRESIEHENMLMEKNAAHTLALICSRMLSMALVAELRRKRDVDRPQCARSKERKKERKPINIK